jgi:hypothetical protein
MPNSIQSPYSQEIPYDGAQHRLVQPAVPAAGSQKVREDGPVAHQAGQANASGDMGGWWTT